MFSAPNSLEIPSGVRATIHFTNRDAAPHNLAVYETATAKEKLFVGEIVDPTDRIDYAIPPLKAGAYYFRCDLHPDMDGKFIVE